MFLRFRKKPKPLQTIDALIVRLKPQHSKLPALRKQAAIYQKGFNGERKLDYHLQTLSNEFSILSDVTLTHQGRSCQIDSLIFSANGIFMTDVKSFEGIVHFDTRLRQFTRHDGEKLNGYKYPITQAENAQIHLIQWLQDRELSGLPIYFFIAFSEYSTIINVTGNEESIGKVVTYVDEIPLRIMKLNEQLKKNNPSNNQLKNKIITAVMNECEDFNYNVFKKFGVDHREIITGVECPACGEIAMERSLYKWLCLVCASSSKDAHIKGLSDYALLYTDKIKNEQCRQFLNINSRITANSILKNSGFPLIKGTKYWSLKTLF